MSLSGQQRRPAEPAGPRPPLSPGGKRVTSFAVDAMHGSLARKLRAFGFDTAYYRDGDDRGLLEVCAKEGRVLVTSDAELLARAAATGVKACGIVGTDDARRLRSLALSARAAGILLRRGDPLCSVCNSRLSKKDRISVRRKVPRSVVNRHREFYQCTGCGQLYWKGSHWKKLRSMGRRLVLTWLGTDN